MHVQQRHIVEFLVCYALEYGGVPVLYGHVLSCGDALHVAGVGIAQQAEIRPYPLASVLICPPPIFQREIAHALHIVGQQLFTAAPFKIPALLVLVGYGIRHIAEKAVSGFRHHGLFELLRHGLSVRQGVLGEIQAEGADGVRVRGQQRLYGKAVFLPLADLGGDVQPYAEGGYGPAPFVENRGVYDPLAAGGRAGLLFVPVLRGRAGSALLDGAVKLPHFLYIRLVYPLLRGLRHVFQHLRYGILLAVSGRGHAV